MPCWHTAMHVVTLALLPCSISAATPPSSSSANWLPCGICGKRAFRDLDALALLQVHASIEKRNGFSNAASFDVDAAESSDMWRDSKLCWELHGKHLLHSHNGTIRPVVAPVGASLLQVSRKPEGTCLGDLCTQSPRVSLTYVEAVERRKAEMAIDRRKAEMANYVQPRRGRRGIQAACPKAPTDDTRLVLVPVVPSYHSSTALEQVLMSSPSLATLCAVGTWQCEGQWIRNELNEKTKRLHPYSLVWDLKRPVFFDKLPGFGGDELDHYYIEPWLSEPIPDTMLQTGIQKIDLAYLLMWRPVCLAQMSSHAIDQIVDNGVHDYALRELLFLENTSYNYRQLVDRNLPVMVVNLGDMLWAPEVSQMRLEGFLPCLGKLDFDFVPQVGKDVSWCNMWKADGSVKAFGESVDPNEKYGYDVATGECDGRFDLFEVLGSNERERANLAIAELTRLSRQSPY